LTPRNVPSLNLEFQAKGKKNYSQGTFTKVRGKKTKSQDGHCAHKSDDGGKKYIRRRERKDKEKRNMQDGNSKLEPTRRIRVTVS